MSSEKEKGEYDPNKKYRDFKWEKPDEFKNGPLGDDKRHCRNCLCCIIFVGVSLYVLWELKEETRI